MTNKQFNLKDTKDIKDINKGTILKRRGDLFIVAEVSKEVDPIYDNLFGGNGYHYYKATKEKMKTEYALISFATGGNFFNSIGSLTDLLYKIRQDNKFEVVETIEFKEVNR